MFSKYTLGLALIVILTYIITVDAQDPSNTDVLPTNMDPATGQENPKVTGQSGRPSGRAGLKTGRRKGRRRRVRVKNRQGKNEVRQGEASKVNVKSPELKPKADADPSKQLPVFNSVPLQQALVEMPVKAEVIQETAAVNVALNREKLGAAAMQDEFFGLFDATTTVGPGPGAPPPDFNVNAPRNKKVIPKVNTKTSKAHDGTPCNETYKPHDIDQTKYMMKYAEGVWETLDCPPNLGSGLIWRQDLCACGEELVAQDPNDWCAQMGFTAHPNKTHKYMRRHHGVYAVKDCPASLVWSQDKCHCMYDGSERPIEQQITFQCKTILQMKFEGNLQNTAEGYYIKPVELKRRGKLPRIRYRKVPGSQEKAAMIVSQPLEFQAYRGNDFQTQVTYTISFKISPRHLNRQNFMILLTDECVSSPNKPRNPSISLAFQPNTKLFQLQFRTEKTELNETISGAIPDKNGWYNVVVYFEDKSVNLENNGKKLFSRDNVEGKVPQNKCPLYIAGRAPGFDRSHDFYGYLDNVNLIKDCKFHQTNIKFL